ncbi:hypothetical protein AAG570_005860 [Ranatra chinensis]|uniref:Aquaporin n=1 Tax=Ranatra chinensis TaxID=642074 RepID=A0ABD0XYZ9_9HEMI
MIVFQRGVGGRGALALGVYELGVSAGYVVLTCFIAASARKLLDLAAPDASTPKLLLQEAIAAWELCAACFELIIVADNYGVWTYALFLFVLTMVWSASWGDAVACPYVHLEHLFEGSTDIISVIAKTWAELSGALVVFGYVKLLWSLETSTTHKGRAYEQCTADLQVPAVLGALVECGATCMCRLVSKIIAEAQPKYGTVVDAFVSTSLVVAAFNYSGGYFNPVLATSLKLGCRGHTVAQHLFVYWLGSSLGALGSVYLFRRPSIRGFVKGLSGSLQ